MDYDKATEKQVDFATAIAEMLGIDLPDEDTKDAYTEFIDENIREFYKEKNRQRYLESDNVYQYGHSYTLKNGYCGDKKLNMNPQKV